MRVEVTIAIVCNYIALYELETAREQGRPFDCKEADVYPPVYIDAMDVEYHSLGRVKVYISGHQERGAGQGNS